MTGSPAIIKAQEIHDLPGDLAPYQEEFLTAVQMATSECVRVRSKAMADHFYGSPEYEDIAKRAYAKERADLAAALARYEQALEDT